MNAKEKACADRVLAEIKFRLDEYEKTHAPLMIDPTVLVAADNCEEGYTTWLQTHAGGRTTLPARELLQLCQATYDSVERVVRTVRVALEQARSAK